MNNSTYGKGKRPASNLKIKIYNEALSKGKCIYWKKKKKEKAHLITLIENNQQIRK